MILRLHQDRLAIAHNPSDALADEPAARQLLRRWTNHWDRHGIGYWAIQERTGPDVVGFCGIKIMTMHGRSVANLFYRLDPAYWGRGLAAEAASIAVDRAGAHSARPIVARVRPENHASARVAVKAGLVRVPDLDTHGEDGPDHVYAAGWPEP